MTSIDPTGAAPEHPALATKIDELIMRSANAEEKKPLMDNFDDAWIPKYLTRIEGIVAEHGWAVQGVFSHADDPAPGPPFFYTVGLSGPQFGHPEFVVVGLNPETAHNVLNDLGERVRGGQRLHAGQRIVGMLRGGYEVELLAVDDSEDERAPLYMANLLYGHAGPVDALQVVLPDQHHRFPWDPGFAAEMRTIQPLLGQRAASTRPVQASRNSHPSNEGAEVITWMATWRGDRRRHPHPR